NSPWIDGGDAAPGAEAFNDNDTLDLGRGAPVHFDPLLSCLTRTRTRSRRVTAVTSPKSRSPPSRGRRSSGCDGGGRWMPWGQVHCRFLQHLPPVASWRRHSQLAEKRHASYQSRPRAPPKYCAGRVDGTIAAQEVGAISV